MKNFLCLLLLVTGCASHFPTESKLRHDMVGHLTGGREKSWLFQKGQIETLTIDSHQGNVYLVSAILKSSEGRFFVRLRITYIGPELESIGLLYIEKL